MIWVIVYIRRFMDDLLCQLIGKAYFEEVGV